MNGSLLVLVRIQLLRRCRFWHLSQENSTVPFVRLDVYLLLVMMVINVSSDSCIG